MTSVEAPCTLYLALTVSGHGGGYLWDTSSTILRSQLGSTLRAGTFAVLRSPGRSPGPSIVPGTEGLVTLDSGKPTRDTGDTEDQT